MRTRREVHVKPFTIIDRILVQVRQMQKLVGVTDVDSLDNLQMDRNTFGRLCQLLKHVGGMKDGRYVLVEEQIAMFLRILANHKKIGSSSLNFGGQGKRCLTMFIVC